MALFTPTERRHAEAISRLVFCNPFLPERMESERDVLGDEFVAADSVWNYARDGEGERANLKLIQARVEALAAAAHGRLAGDARPADVELRLYEDVILYLLYYRNHERFLDVILRAPAKVPPGELGGLFDRFAGDVRHFLRVGGVELPAGRNPAHLFACLFQIRRAFHAVFTLLVGASLPAARLRAAAWQSVFTHDLRRFQRVLFDKTGDWTTLVTGPSGTGKELVARSIAASRYVPFDPKARAFAGDFSESFHPLNLSALSPTLIESELFGHRRGAFTGALEDRAGWLEACPPSGTIFLDEIGELDPLIQVKLLRVLQDPHVPAAGRHQGQNVQGEDHRRHQPRLGGGDVGGRVPEGFLLPPLLRPHRHAEPPRATGRQRRRVEEPGAVHRPPGGAGGGRAARRRGGPVGN